MPFNNFQPIQNDLSSNTGLHERPDIAALRLKAQLEPTNLICRYQLIQSFNEANDPVAVEELLNEILEIDSNDICALVSLAIILAEKQMPKEALDHYDRATKYGPLTLNNLAKKVSKLKTRGQVTEATALNSRIEILRDNIAVAHGNTGAIYLNAGNIQKALKALNQALKINPNFEDARCTSGILYEKFNQPEKAIENFKKVLKVNPHNKNALIGLGNNLKSIGQRQEAITYFQTAIAIDPHHSDALVNIGACLRELGHTIEAIDYTKRVIEYDPTYVNAWSNLGSYYYDLNRTEEAEFYYSKAIELDPENAGFKKNLALCKIRDDCFIDGLKLYDQRWFEKNTIVKFLASNRPVWNLQRDKRVFFWAEQGLGDEIMFASMYSEVFPLCSQVFVQADRRLHELYQRSFGKNVKFIDRTQKLCESEYDYHLPIGSLMQFFLQAEDRLDIPQEPYLKPNDNHALQIRNNILGDNTKELIGLNWKTKSAVYSHVRSLDLDTIFNSIEIENRIFVSLQYGDVNAEIRELFEKRGITIVQYPKIDNFSDIDGLAALIAACDAVITTDNATLHLTCALGKQCHGLLPAAGDWRWGQKSNKSYWYASLDLHRNPYGGDWRAALQSASKAAATAKVPYI